MFKRLMNLPEFTTDERLRQVCDEFDAKVHPKVRIADVLPIEGSGISDGQFRYALQAHFDFVICDSGHNVLFAVEFDGPAHNIRKNQQRDEVKNALCDRFEMPLLRINHNYLRPSFSNWDLLRWFCTVWFVKQLWDEDVKAGKIPPKDSFFDPMFVSVKTKRGMRDWNSKETRAPNLGACSEQDGFLGTCRAGSLQMIPAGHYEQLLG